LVVGLAKFDDRAPQYPAGFSGILNLCFAELHRAMMQTWTRVRKSGQWLSRAITKPTPTLFESGLSLQCMSPLLTDTVEKGVASIGAL
jgi:hypothetical protein